MGREIEISRRTFLTYTAAELLRRGAQGIPVYAADKAPTPTPVPTATPWDHMGSEKLIGAEAMETATARGIEIFGGIFGGGQKPSEPIATFTPEDQLVHQIVEQAPNDSRIVIPNAHIRHIVRLRSKYCATLVDSKGNFLAGVTNADALWTHLVFNQKLGRRKAKGVWEPNAEFDQLNLNVLSEEDLLQLPAILELESVTENGVTKPTPKLPSLLEKVTVESARDTARSVGKGAMVIMMGLIRGIEEGAEGN